MSIAGALNFKMAASRFVNLSDEVRLLAYLDSSNHYNCNKICAMLSLVAEFATEF